MHVSHKIDVAVWPQHHPQQQQKHLPPEFVQLTAAVCQGHLFIVPGCPPPAFALYPLCAPPLNKPLTPTCCMSGSGMAGSSQGPMSPAASAAATCSTTRRMAASLCHRLVVVAVIEGQRRRGTGRG